MDFGNIDHTEQGVERLSFDLKKENIEKLLTLFLEKQNELETALTGISEIKDIRTATGVWLDYIGSLVGQPRNYLSDEDYRVAVLFRMAVNTSTGTPDNIISLIKSFTSSENVKLIESGVAFGTIAITEGNSIGHELYELLQEIKPCGTRWLIHSDFNNDAFIFAYEDRVHTLELFKTTENTVDFEVFNTKNVAGDYSGFITTVEELGYNEKTLIDGRNSFFSESGFNFQTTTDGVNYTDFEMTTPTGVNTLVVVVPYETSYISGGPTLHWEVEESSEDLI